RTQGQDLYVFHRSLAATDLAFLMAPAEGYRFADSVGLRGVAASAPDPRAVETFQRAWTSASPTIAVLLDLAGRPLPRTEGASAATTAPVPAPPPAPTAAPVSPQASEATSDFIDTLSDGEITGE